MNKPEGPNPPEGYRWVDAGHVIWPSDVMSVHSCGSVALLRADVAGVEYGLAKLWYQWMRPKVTQPDLAWLKSKALDQAKLHPAGSVERERILWAVTEAVRAYSDALRALVPEREQWRPDQKGGEA